MNKTLNIKVCGMKFLENRKAVSELNVNLLGFIFYPQSKRYFGDLNERDKKLLLNTEKEKVGVFVNENVHIINIQSKKHNLSYVQLHGDETVDYCRQLKKSGQKIIKVFRVNEAFDFRATTEYEATVDFFLFDTKAGLYGGTGEKFNWKILNNYQGATPFFLSGGIKPNDVKIIKSINHPKLYGVDLNSGFEDKPGFKSISKLSDFITKLKNNIVKYQVNEKGYYGEFGGAWIPEMMHANIKELRTKYIEIINSNNFQNEFKHLLKNYVGRPSPLYFAKRLSKHYKTNIYLKREDLNHTGSHKLNNTVGQILLAQELGKTRIIAETGAGQHGVATATVCALKGIKCVVYMGALDVKRQAPNVKKMKMLGADVISVHSGNKTLKDATNEAMRDWINNPVDTHYIIGSVVGPHPYPDMVARFQSIISKEMKSQLKEHTGNSFPTRIIACVGGGSNAAGAFYHFLENEEVELIGVEAAGKGVDTNETAATLKIGSPGVLHASKTILMQNSDGQITEPYSISAGLDYPGIGPMHAYLNKTGRAKFLYATDKEVLDAALFLTQKEGIIPALESAHALAALNQINFDKNDITVVNLSGRGDKDMQTYLDYFGY